MFASIDVMLSSLCLLFFTCVATDLQNNCSANVLTDYKFRDFRIFTSKPLGKYASLFRLPLRNLESLYDFNFIENRRLVIKLTNIIFNNSVDLV